MLWCLVLVTLVRWVFKVNRAIELLESIDESLRQMPAAQAYRARKKGQSRRVA